MTHHLTPVLAATKRLHTVLGMLGPKEQLYIDSRLQGTPPVAAARVAGFEYPVDASTQLEGDERVRAAIEYSIHVRAHEMQITRQDVLAGMLEAVQMAATATEMVSAWREIGKIIGAYEPTKIEVNHVRRDQIRQLDDEQLAEMAAIEGEYEILNLPDHATPQGDDDHD